MQVDYNGTDWKRRINHPDSGGGGRRHLLMTVLHFIQLVPACASVTGLPGQVLARIMLKHPFGSRLLPVWSYHKDAKMWFPLFDVRLYTKKECLIHGKQHVVFF